MARELSFHPKFFACKPTDLRHDLGPMDEMAYLAFQDVSSTAGLVRSLTNCRRASVLWVSDDTLRSLPKISVRKKGHEERTTEDAFRLHA